MARIDPFNPHYDTPRSDFEYTNRAYAGSSGVGAFVALLLLLGFIIAAIAFGSREPGPTGTTPAVNAPITQPMSPIPTTPPRAPGG
jgi:hypothetical protein